MMTTNTIDKDDVTKRDVSYSVHQTTTPSRAQEELFITMELRKLQRDLYGTKKKHSRTNVLALLALLLVLYGVSVSVQERTFTATLSFTFGQIVAIGFWIFLSVVLTNVFADRHFIVLLYWMLVYWPVLAILASFLFTGNTEITDVIWILLIVMEVLTLCVFIAQYYLRPKIMRSSWFQRNATMLYNIQVVSKWTMTYGRWGNHYTCKYQGEFKDDDVNDTSLPSGFGQWLDDSRGGEVLTGYWDNGQPVAPFVSRRFDTGDGFGAVQIPYFAATDDGFDSNKLVPSNVEPPKCGVAHVECSVQGSFYNHLPEARSYYGPKVIKDQDADDDANSLAACFARIKDIGDQRTDHDAVFVGIDAGDPRGIQVVGHVNKETGLNYVKDCGQIVVKVQYIPEEQQLSRSSNFMPFPSFRNSSDQVLYEQSHRALSQSLLEPNNQESVAESQSKPSSPELSTIRTHPRLSVQDWERTSQKDALVYIPGFNSCIKKSASTLGQFLALTEISKVIHPVLFAWPNGQVPTYRHASAIAATPRNKELFLKLLTELKHAGFRNVHLMSHSLGVQTLLGVFGSNEDGGRSDVSKCFQLDHAFQCDQQIESDALLVCKSITMLNPDFPVDAFVHHAFASIRKICNHITLVGDRNDKALFYSQFINGTMAAFGYSQPDILNPDGKPVVHGTRKQRKPKHQQVIGRHIDALRLPSAATDLGSDLENGDSQTVDERLLFKRVTPLIISRASEEIADRWLDLDVIDTTLLDTNFNDLRHSAFNVNPILFNDLEELLVRGERAERRSSLLFREGNIYSYCSVPAFVSM